MGINSLKTILQENVSMVSQRIGDAARRSGRRADSVRLVCVTKQVDVPVVRQLVDLGVRDLGENRPQELWRKYDQVSGPVCWHLIGHLQRNKVKRTLPLVQMIHSVDSLTLLRRIDSLAVELGQRAEVLLEVNVSGEQSKHGLQPEAMPELIEQAEGLTGVRVNGLMTMAPYSTVPQSARPTFAQLRELRDRLQDHAGDKVQLEELSMGMSGDYEVAIEEGATMVRIGSALFRGLSED